MSFRLLKIQLDESSFYLQMRQLHLHLFFLLFCILIKPELHQFLLIDLPALPCLLSFHCLELIDFGLYLLTIHDLFIELLLSTLLYHLPFDSDIHFLQISLLLYVQATKACLSFLLLKLNGDHDFALLDTLLSLLFPVTHRFFVP